MTPADPIDIAALRARLREYDKTLPRCKGTVEEDRNYAPDFVSEEGRAEWNMTFHHPCCRPEGHDGPCRNTRPVLGWPGFAVVTALLDEVERLRKHRELCTENLLKGYETGKTEERERVVAYLRDVSPNAPTRRGADELTWCANRIERGDHRRKEQKA